MKISFWIAISSLTVSLAVAGCKGASGSGNGHHSRGTLDISGFRNTETRKGFNEKAEKASGFVEETDALRSKYTTTQNSSGSGNGLLSHSELALADKSFGENEPY